MLNRFSPIQYSHSGFPVSAAYLRLSPLESALPKCGVLTPLESAHTKRPGEGTPITVNLLSALSTRRTNSANAKPPRNKDRETGHCPGWLLGIPRTRDPRKTVRSWNMVRMLSFLFAPAKVSNPWQHAF
jgi:hypothetical protein